MRGSAKSQKPAPRVRRATSIRTQSEASDVAVRRDDRHFDFYTFSPLAYLRHSSSGVIEDINPAAEAMFSATTADLCDRPLLMSVTFEDRSAFLEHMSRCRRTPATVETDLCLKARDGRVFPARLYTRRSASGSRPSYWTVVLDLTEQRGSEDARQRAEQQTQNAEREKQTARDANDAKDRFLAMLSHELRTPLTPALFAASRLLEEDLSDRLKRMAALIKRNIEMEARLINDLLDVTRIGRGRLELKLAIIDLHALAREATDTCRAQIREKNLEVHLDFQAASYYVQGDRSRLHQVVCNLLINAAKFTDKGSITVTTLNDEPGSMRLIVRDTGLGMKQETLDTLFEPFEHRPGQASRGGLGLGLTICKAIIDAHSGRIWATSSGLGTGATFEFELATLPEGLEPVSEAAAPRAAPDKSLRILVVEDDADTLAMLSVLLTSEGHDVAVARTVRDAIGHSREPFDVIISDLGLPDGSGFDVVRHLGRTNEGRPRLIALTGYGSEKDAAMCLQAGFDEHLVKPLDLGRLRVALAK